MRFGTTFPTTSTVICSSRYRTVALCDDEIHKVAHGVLKVGQVGARLPVLVLPSEAQQELLCLHLGNVIVR